MNSYFIKFRLMMQVMAHWLSSQSMKFLIKKDAQQPVHILFCMVDHYEPGSRNATPETEVERVDRLLMKYPQLADRHRDYAGNIVKRTWFFPPHYHRYQHLKKLVSLCHKGFGEIELHLHHGKTKPDTRVNLTETIKACLEAYAPFGIFGRIRGLPRYGFIHGDWALDNSRNNQFCGVSQEIEVLINTGCYADFTFPAVNQANPDQINSVFYTTDRRGPKSYAHGVHVQTNRQPPAKSLMIIEGPLHPYIHGQPPFLRYFGDAVDGVCPVYRRRVDTWVRTGIHVKGKPNWIILKIHTHGATDADAVLGPEMDRILSHLEDRYNDGIRYRLHYVAARELYNIIKAVEAGAGEDDPEMFRDFEIPPPKYDPSPDICSAPPFLLSLIERTYPIEWFKFHHKTKIGKS